MNDPKQGAIQIRRVSGQVLSLVPQSRKQDFKPVIAKACLSKNPRPIIESMHELRREAKGHGLDRSDPDKFAQFVSAIHDLERSLQSSFATHGELMRATAQQVQATQQNSLVIAYNTAATAANNLAVNDSTEALRDLIKSNAELREELRQSRMMTPPPPMHPPLSSPPVEVRVEVNNRDRSLVDWDMWTAKLTVWSCVGILLGILSLGVWWPAGYAPSQPSQPASQHPGA